MALAKAGLRRWLVESVILRRVFPNGASIVHKNVRFNCVFHAQHVGSIQEALGASALGPYPGIVCVCVFPASAVEVRGKTPCSPLMNLSGATMAMRRTGLDT